MQNCFTMAEAVGHKRTGMWRLWIHGILIILQIRMFVHPRRVNMVGPGGVGQKRACVAIW